MKTIWKLKRPSLILSKAFNKIKRNYIMEALLEGNQNTNTHELNMLMYKHNRGKSTVSKLTKVCDRAPHLTWYWNIS